jgi:cytochrome P450
LKGEEVLEMSSKHSIAELPPIELPTVRASLFDPPPELVELRAQQPLCRLRYSDGHIGWMVTSYQLARVLLADPRIGVDFSIRRPRLPIGFPRAERIAELQELWSPEHDKSEAIWAGDMLVQDPPNHARLRRLHSAHFTVRRIGEYRARIERIVADRLDAMEQAGAPVDLYSEFALAISSMTICELLGVPYTDRERFEQPAAAHDAPNAGLEDMRTAWEAEIEYAREVIERKRANTGEDLLSELVATSELPPDELVGAARELFRAGHHTTASQLALSVFALLFDRERWETLRANPAMINGAVEELLRYLTIFQYGPIARTALEDIDLEGTVIKAGDSIHVSLAAANRDPSKFAEPDRCDVSRDASGHIAFGHGRHVCLGQHLARLELQISLAGLIGRFPTLRLAVPAEEVPMHTRDSMLHGVYQLPVTW